MKPSLAWLLVCATVLAGCAPPPPTPAPRTLVVFAAASLTQAFTAIGRQFEAANPQVTIRFNFAGSQTLRTQIEEGAPADVFASASGRDMERLVAGGLVAAPAPQVFVSNRLVVILPANNPARLTTLADLAQPGVKLVLAAENVPAGSYARQALANLNSALGDDFAVRVLANVVSNEDNVRQVVAKVQLGEADAGVVYASDTVAAPDLPTLAIPPAFNVVARYPIAPLAASAQAELAQAFVAYVLSEPGQAILQQWGFAPPE